MYEYGKSERFVRIVHTLRAHDHTTPSRDGEGGVVRSVGSIIPNDTTTESRKDGKPER